MICKQTLILSLVLLLAMAGAEAAKKPEPLTYTLSGKRYTILLPNSQLWSEHEWAMAGVRGKTADEVLIAGKAVRRARVRGMDGDRTNRNYLVIVMRTGKRLSPLPKYFVRPDPWMGRVITPAPPIPPAAAPMKSKPKVMTAPTTILLTWDDMPGAVPGGWGDGPLIMPDGGTRFWTVYCSSDARTWRPLDVVETNRCVVGLVRDAEFYRVHWRDEGSPSWVFP